MLNLLRFLQCVDLGWKDRRHSQKLVLYQYERNLKHIALNLQQQLQSPLAACMLHCLTPKYRVSSVTSLTSITYKYNIFIAGKSTCVIVIFVNADWFGDWKEERVQKRDQVYESRKSICVDQVWKQVVRHFPVLENRV